MWDFQDLHERAHGVTAKLEDKDKLRDQIAKQIEEFLAKGGEVETLEYDDTAEKLARIGHWTKMNDLPITSEGGESVVDGYNGLSEYD